MNFLDRKRVEIECVCGGKGIHLVADVYTRKAVICRLCRRDSKLDDRQNEEIVHHIEGQLDAVLREISERRED